MDTKPKYKILRELMAGGASCTVASAFLNPMDVIKVRLQTQPAGLNMYTSFSQTTKRIFLEEGIKGVWLPGITASLVREALYSSIRIGLYPLVKQLYSGNRDGDAGFLRKFASGLTTGALGSAFASPTDLVKIRIQSEAGLVENGIYKTGLRTGFPPSYRNTWHAFIVIAQKEGISGLYKGVEATVARAALLTAGQMASYDHSKHLLKKYQIFNEGIPLHVVASLISGLAATTAAAPADIIKTRVMNDRKSGQSLYKGSMDCLFKIIRHEGPQGLLRGWVPSYLRLGPHFIISLPLFEQFRTLMGLNNM